MKTLWVHRTIDAPAQTVWALLTDPDRWPEWGPSVRSAEVDGGQLEPGATGSVSTPLGFDVPFVITEYVDGERWAWKVAGIAATDHTVEPLGAATCRVGFGMPWAAAPYTAVCRIALARLDKLAQRERTGS